ncbi:retrovirus-related Pol polyprotein from transposon 297 [Trichonephila clavipes]|nr:retrovirus-related Pol polyprotein from transposon 297 [Trichonephila clavipes]
MDLFLTLFERQMKLLDLGEDLWVPYLIGALPSDVTSLIARWLKELKIDSFDGLKNLMIADQLKKKCSPECKEHYLDIWEELISPEMLADKLEAFYNIRRSLHSGPIRYVKASEIVNDGRQVSFRKSERPPNREYSHLVPNERSPLRCYGCGKQGVIKSRCPICNLNASQRTDVSTKHINAYTPQTRSPRLTVIDITFSGIKGRVCADTGSSHSIAGERMFQIFKNKGLLFRETTLAMSLADSQQTTGEALTTQVMVEIEGRSVLTKFIILPKAKGNRTLLGTDFLSSAGLVLDVKNTCWYFWDNPTHKYPFGEELDTPSIVEKISSNTCQLREMEGESLTSSQKEKLNLLLESFQTVFEPAGKATNILEHHINTGNSSPNSVPPFRMTPVKKETLRKKIEDLLKKDIIEECESPYGAPVVLIPNPNNQFRLCIDYRKLNEVTVSDTYPLPRMGDLLQEAKHTTYISTIDLKSGYHQMNVNPADRDKTAFPIFSEIARPLNNLTKKKAFWKWSEEEEKAFQTLKQCLVSPQILKQADFSKSFLIRTDASNYALGAVLLQGEDKEEHPVEFASRLLNPAERNYSSTEREALAVVWAVNKFRGYTDGASITVASDHQALRWLMKLKSPTGRLARWALQLQSFNLNMEYIPGKSNVIADMLSRPACNEENEL